MKAKTYITEIRAQVKANHGGEVPKELEGTIRDYAAAKELRDVYREAVIKEPTITEVGSMGNMMTKQNPLCNLLYQQEGLCQTYAKMLGLTAAKAAVKTEGQGDRQATENIDEYLRTIQGWTLNIENYMAKKQDSQPQQTMEEYLLSQLDTPVVLNWRSSESTAKPRLSYAESRRKWAKAKDGTMMQKPDGSPMTKQVWAIPTNGIAP